MANQRFLSSSAIFCGVLSLVSIPSTAQSIAVKAEQKINSSLGGFGGTLQLDSFGSSVCPLGDLDGDGVPDLAVGAQDDNDGDLNTGAVWILFMNPDGTVKAEQKISTRVGGFLGPVDPWGNFGWAVASPGDLDGDGLPELAVGAPYDDGLGCCRYSGSAWILFLNADGTVRAERKFDEVGLGLGPTTMFGSAMAGLGDVNGDGIGDLAIGSRGQNAVWIMLMNPDGSTLARRKLSLVPWGFYGYFGSSVSALGDLDGDGIGELAVGAPFDSEAADQAGAVWILFLKANGDIRAARRIATDSAGFGGELDALDQFGRGLSSVGDLDGDGVADLAVGARGDDDDGTLAGALWLLFLDPDGSVKAERKITGSTHGFGGTLDPFDNFGYSVAPVGDLDGNGVLDLAVGAIGDDFKAPFTTGALWILFLEPARPRSEIPGVNPTGAGTRPAPF